MAEQRGLGIWIAVALLAGLVGAFVESRSSGPFDADDAVACAARAADRLGQDIGAPTATERGGSWEVTAGGRGVVLRLVIRGADSHITDVELLRNGNADILDREQRLDVLEAGC